MPEIPASKTDVVHCPHCGSKDTQLIDQRLRNIAEGEPNPELWVADKFFECHSCSDVLVFMVELGVTS